MNTKDLFVSSYDINKRLQEKGFNEGCFGVIYPDGEILFGSPDLTDIMIKRDTSSIKAIMYQQVIDWLRKERTIDIVFVPPIAWQIQTYNKSIDIITIPIKDGKTIKEEENNYYEAINKAIEEALKLI